LFKERGLSFQKYSVGILTCKEIPHLTEDDLIFCEILKKDGIAFRAVIWDEAVPETLGVTHLLIRSPWDYHFRVDLFIDFLKNCEACGITVINNSKIVDWNHTKIYLRGLLEDNNRIVDSFFFTKDDELADIQEEVRSLGWKEIVVKPVISATSHLTFRTHVDAPELSSQLSQITDRCEGMIQPFVPSIATDGEVSLIYFKGDKTIFSHAALKKPKAGDFRVQVDFGGSAEVFAPSPELVSFGLKTLDHVRDPWLYARVDIVNWRKDPRISEVEMIEPNLFFALSLPSAQLFVDALKTFLK
jgi:glutathione synthase/RimK-type ligase-like ATP-grasp enzyme